MEFWLSEKDSEGTLGHTGQEFCGDVRKDRVREIESVDCWKMWMSGKSLNGI